MENTIRRAISITGIEDKDGKVTIMEQVGEQKYPTRYSFFKLKQDGTKSKAFEQYETMGVATGKVYEIAVKEIKGTNKMSGKEVTYRNIAFFYTGEPSMPTQQPRTQPSPNSDLTATNARIDKAAEVIKDMDNRLKAMEMQIIVMSNEISELRK
jgi:hypothetical protein